LKSKASNHTIETLPVTNAGIHCDMLNRPTQLVTTGVTSGMTSYNEVASANTAFNDVTCDRKTLIVDEDNVVSATTSRVANTLCEVQNGVMKND